ncbi:glycosyltransferase family 4 protein [Coleofasciculus chthonoplastes]|uniref:glycosyltransferase family 4 protein n=1 Tax=Coleofasciculus chthonoplastes TaxID=64178 RepID=UPI003303F6CB
MRIAIATVQVPFIRGGAEMLAAGLVEAIRQAGHEADVISMPFHFYPVREVKRSMEIWNSENFEAINGYNIDLVICLKFPTFYLKHPHKVAWIIHQHRAVYDLWDTSFTQGLSDSDEGKKLREEIVRRDTHAFQKFKKVFTIAKTVSHRLQYFNQIDSTALYNPPKLANYFYTAAAEPYIFFPSRLENLKRQDLLIKAMTYVKSPTVALLAGEGGQKPNLLQMIEAFDLQQRVKLMGQISDEDMLAFYAHCLGVFFGVHNEDYGYVTLEAMLAAKPVITCTDSGGSLEFVINHQTGLVVEPEPDAIAQAIDQLYFNQKAAAEMGKAGLERYHSLNISWENVVQKLLY